MAKFKGQYFKQLNGIPQGSCISSLLCSFYYDDMVKECFPGIDHEKELLLHYVDDFLYMTHDPMKAKHFLDTMTQGIAQYNCYVNSAKTTTNFAVDDDGSLSLNEELKWITWCGVQINVSSLEVRSDYAKYTSKKIRDHLSIVTHPRPFINLHNLIQRAVGLKCQPIFLDCQSLSERTVFDNIYQLFLLLAIKTHSALWTLGLRGYRIRRYSKFIFCVIVRSTKYFYNRARARCRERGCASTTFTVPFHICLWLCCHAYRRVFKVKDQEGYHLLARILSSNICRLNDKMGLHAMKRCLRATYSNECKSIIKLKC